jgi:hypothetical protein
MVSDFTPKRSMKTRSDSLYARLSPTQREDLLSLLLEECASTETALEVCRKWGVKASKGAISRLIASHSLSWRLQRAQEVALATEDALPANWEETQRRVLGQKIFEAVCANETSNKEMIALKKLQLSEDQLKIEDRRVVLLEKKVADAQKIITNTKLTPEEREQKMKEVFGLA